MLKFDSPSRLESLHMAPTTHLAAMASHTFTHPSPLPPKTAPCPKGHCEVRTCQSVSCASTAAFPDGECTYTPLSNLICQMPGAGKTGVCAAGVCVGMCSKAMTTVVHGASKITNEPFPTVISDRFITVLSHKKKGRRMSVT